MSEILKVSDAVKIFGNGSVSTRALDGISFAIEKGEFVAVMGPSGSGKSTLLNVISTIESLSSGKIIADGINISSIGEKELADFRRDKLGFIFQEYNLLDTLTVEENIALPLNLKKEGAKETKEKVLKVSEALGVTDQLAKFPSALSGGQRQRVACARAVITSRAYSCRRTYRSAGFAQLKNAYGTTLPYEPKTWSNNTDGNARRGRRFLRSARNIPL